MIRRHIERNVRAALADTPVVLINGARQAGKTTLARMVAADTGASYYTFDDAATMALAVGDPSGFVRSLTGPVVIDEIQKAPELMPAIKLAVDRHRQPGRFLLTGSANVMTLPRLSESLAGRMEVVALHPFSVGELAGVREAFLPRLFSGAITKIKPKVGSDEIPFLVARGGFPEATQRRAEDRRDAWFASYLSTVLGRDVRDLARIDALHALPNLLKVLASRTSGLLNLADVGRDAGLPHATLTRYVALLEALFLVHRLPSWSLNLGKRLVKAPKIHLLDTGIACHLLGANRTTLARDRPLFGRLLETFVVGELRKQLSWTDPRTALCHFRTSAGAEVDVVLERPDGSVAGIEVKASATASPSDFTALASLRDNLGARFRSGIVLYLGDAIVPSGNRLWLVPVQALWCA